MMNNEPHEHIASGPLRRMIRTRTRRKLFVGEKRIAFLEELAATCNVVHSAQYAGVTPKTAYNHRHADPRFAEAWDRALEQGYARLEAEVLSRMVGPAIEFDGGAEPHQEFDWYRAMELLRLHRSPLTAGPKRGGRTHKPVPVEEARRMLIKKLTCIGVLKKPPTG